MIEYSISASKINLSFNDVPILKDVDFKVKRGEVHALVGTNGAGKSSLMKVINGVYAKDSGQISLFGKPADYASPETAREKGISMVFQDLSLVPSLTVTENIFLQTHPHRKGPLIDDAKAEVVMTAHICYPQIDPKNPATLSSVMLNDILRDKLGFKGVILSDSMNMGAIRRFYDPAESTILALKAGVDLTYAFGRTL